MISHVPIFCPICGKRLTFECYGSLEPEYQLTCPNDYCAEIIFDDDWNFACLFYCWSSNPNIKVNIEKRRGSQIFPEIRLLINARGQSPISQQLPFFDINNFNLNETNQKIKILLIFQ